MIGSAISWKSRQPNLHETLVNEGAPSDRGVSLDAGFTAAFTADEAVVVSGNNHSVLKSLCNTVANVPGVSLRESEAETNDPIARPSSPEIPNAKDDTRYQLQGGDCSWRNGGDHQGAGHRPWGVI